MHSADQSGPRITAGPSHGVEVYFRRTRQVRPQRGDHSQEFVDLLCGIGVGVHKTAQTLESFTTFAEVSAA